jgi:hypothetical protein
VAEELGGAGDSSGSFQHNLFDPSAFRGTRYTKVKKIAIIIFPEANDILPKVTSHVFGQRKRPTSVTVAIRWFSSFRIG